MRWLIVLLPWAALAQPVDGETPSDGAEAPAEAPAKPAPALPDAPGVAQAKAAYNDGNYNDASRRFLKLAQAMPLEAGLYRALARARVYAGDHEGAVVAYRFYLQLVSADTEGADKIRAELKLAERKVGRPIPAGPPGKTGRTLAAAEVRAKAGTFAGPDGAFGAIAAAVEGGYIGPELADVRMQVRRLLRTKSEDALTAWWRPEQRVSGKNLAALAAGWAEAAADQPTTPAETPLVQALAGLSKLRAGEVDAALSALAEVAPGDPRLRYAQAVALYQAERFDEARQVLTALGGQVEDQRVSILSAMVAVRQGQPAAQLRQALLE